MSAGASSGGLLMTSSIVPRQSADQLGATKPPDYNPLCLAPCVSTTNYTSITSLVIIVFSFFFFSFYYFSGFVSCGELAQSLSCSVCLGAGKQSF